MIPHLGVSATVREIWIFLSEKGVTIDCHIDIRRSLAMPKKITKRQHTGRTGEVFVGYLFEKLGLKWHESKTDVGIDCHVEWRNSETGEVTNRHIGIQVKSSSGAFSAETSTKFEQLCSEDDIEYWLKGTMPVLLGLLQTMGKRSLLD